MCEVVWKLYFVQDVCREEDRGRSLRAGPRRACRTARDPDPLAEKPDGPVVRLAGSAGTILKTSSFHFSFLDWPARFLIKAMRALGVSVLVIVVLWAGLGVAPVAGQDATQNTPETADIPPGGLAWNFRLVGYNPLLDSNQGSSSFDPYINPPLGIPRGSNGDITAAGDCVYVGSLIGYQPALIVNVSDPTLPSVVGAVPDLVPGVGNGIEGIE